ncbi:hypothetical protein ACYTYC_09905, partial [Streptococcus pyogenes]
MAIQETSARKGGMSLGGEVDGRACARGRKSNQRGEPCRSLEGLDCLGMLAGNASEHASSVRRVWASVVGESAL